VLAKVLRKLKGIVADDLRSIFYASRKEKALEFFPRSKRGGSLNVEQSQSCLLQAGEIIARKQACYNLLAFICLKMELHCLAVARHRVINIISRWEGLVIRVILICHRRKKKIVIGIKPLGDL